MDPCLLTFAVPFHSRSGTEFLSRTLQSVLMQTELNWQLVVVDDCSPIEGVHELVDSYQDARFRYHKNEHNLGQAGCWNECKRLVTTPYYTILHADDELMPNYAALMLKAFEAHPDAGAITCAANIIDGQGEEIFSLADFIKRFIRPSADYMLEGESGLHALLSGNFIMCPTVCYQASLTKDIDFSGKWKHAPDMQYWFQLLTSGRRIYGLRDVAFRYRRHAGGGTAVARKNMQMFYDEVGLYDEIAADCLACGWHRAAARAHRKVILRLHVLSAAITDLAHVRMRAALAKARYGLRMRQA